MLDGGEEVRAPLVVTAVHPKITFLQQLDRAELPSSFVHDIEHWKTRSGTVKVNLAIDRLPTFTADPDFDPEIHGGAIELLDDVEQLEQAYQQARFGEAATRPFSDTEIPTVVDTTLAPEGIHTVSMFTQWCPAEWADDEDDHTDELEAYADRLIDHMDEVAPGFRDSVLARQILGPKQMQEGWDLIGGNIFHGELTVDQLFHMRPAVGYADYRIADRRPLPGVERHARRWRRDRPARSPLRARDPARQEEEDAELGLPCRARTGEGGQA